MLLRIYSRTGRRARGKQHAVSERHNCAPVVVECQRGQGNRLDYVYVRTSEFDCLTVRNRDRPAGKVFFPLTSRDDDRRQRQG